MVPLAEVRDDPETTLKFIKEVPDVAVYGFLLSSSADDSLAEMVKKKWMELHHLVGDRFLLVVFQPPAKLEASFKSYWKRRLGDSFAEAWKDWKQPVAPGAAFDYLEFFDKKIKPSELPCLVLFTDPGERKAVVRSIPNWDVDSLYQLFIGIAEVVREASSHPKDSRLEFLRESLTSFGSRAGAYLGYAKDKTLEYIKKNPAKIVVTAASLAVALTTANILPLTPAFVALLTEIKSAAKEK